MKNDELAAKLAAMGTETTVIAAGVQKLLDAIAAAATNTDVPQNVMDAANNLQASLDALKTEAGA